MTSERIKEIQQETAYPNSVSVQQALLKVWNECEQERVKNCSIPAVGNRFFKWFYTIFITGLAAILNYCFDIPQPILSGLNLFLIAIAANKIADQHNRLKNG